MIWKWNWDANTAEESRMIYLSIPTTFRGHHPKAVVRTIWGRDLMRQLSGIANLAVMFNMVIITRLSMLWVEHWGGLLRWFTLPPFIIYDGKTDPIEHVSHYIQIMSLYSHNDRYSRLVLAQLLRDGLTDWGNDQFEILLSWYRSSVPGS